MALQLGALRDALIDACAQPDKARAVAEGAASYETGWRQWIPVYPF
jgi:hypothetical protein